MTYTPGQIFEPTQFFIFLGSSTRPLEPLFRHVVDTTKTHTPHRLTRALSQTTRTVPYRERFRVGDNF
jgi:hypothetical protein